MKKGKICFGIYDDYKMQRQFLHHTLEREKYEILYSAGTTDLLNKYFSHERADILLIHARSVNSHVQLLLRNFFETTNGTLKIIFYACADKNYPKLLPVFKKYEKNIFYADDDVHSFYKHLDAAINSFLPKKNQGSIPHKILLPPEHPFYKIVNNRSMIEIIRLLSAGKNFREISNSLELSEHTVRTYIRRMRFETDCVNITQLVVNAKEFHLI